MSLLNLFPLAFLVIINLGLIWLLIGVPIGAREVVVRRRIAATPAKLWSALFPLGENASWDGTYLSVQQKSSNTAELAISYDGRDGKPIRRTVQFDDVEEGRSFTQRTIEDSSLHASFWANHRERTELSPDGEGTLVTLRESDVYKGFAFLGFRYFKNRRHINSLDQWARTGQYQSTGIFEKLPMQVAMAVCSALILWPFFGFTRAGLMLSAMLTAVVVLHEAGHMFAFRAMGHKSARMIIIPFLGGIALGGRPYNSHFEVGFSALMGAGFSVFPVIAAISLYAPLHNAGFTAAAALAGAFGTIGALFNLGNLVPVWKFDGGQVIRQVFRSKMAQGIASFVLLAGLLAVGKAGGFSNEALLVAGVVFSVLSIVTAGTGVKPRDALNPMTQVERVLVFCGLLAAFSAHAAGAIWGLNFYL